MYHLNKSTTGDIASKLSRMDIEDLPQRIMYEGVSEEFSCDEARAFELLAIIFENINLMQEEKVKNLKS